MLISGKWEKVLFFNARIWHYLALFAVTASIVSFGSYRLWILQTPVTSSLCPNYVTLFLLLYKHWSLEGTHTEPSVIFRCCSSMYVLRTHLWTLGRVISTCLLVVKNVFWQKIFFKNQHLLMMLLLLTLHHFHLAMMIIFQNSQEPLLRLRCRRLWWNCFRKIEGPSSERWCVCLTLKSKSLKESL